MKVDPFFEVQELLEVARAACYQRRCHAPSARDATDAELTGKIRRILDSNGTFGTPRIVAELPLVAELPRQRETVSHRRVGWLMRHVGGEGRAKKNKKKWRTTTIPVPDPPAAAADRLKRRLDVHRITGPVPGCRCHPADAR